MATTTAAAGNSLNPFNDPTRPSSASHLNQPETGYLDEELPPAYTPSPDFQHGESTVQYGPSRPFQPAPLQPAQAQAQHLRPPVPPAIHVQSPPRSPSLLRQIADTITSSINELSDAMNDATNPQRATQRPTSSAYPGAVYRASSSSQNLGPSPTSPTSPRAPPLPPRPASTTNASPVSEFARDFYAAGTGTGDQSQYPPPDGPPPTSAATSSSAHAHAPAPASTAPTSTPTPGRPLLHNGKLLVYPKGFVCNKCDNIGYKHADPSHPCKKCWSRYAKPFSGPLTYAFAAPASPGDTSTTVFQRPLPALLPPQNRRRSRSRSRSRERHQRERERHARERERHERERERFERDRQRERESYSFRGPASAPPSSQMFGGAGAGAASGYSPAYYQPRSPPPPQHPQHPQAQVQQLRTLDPWSAPPPGALVYPAGDPRLGGNMCWNCSGRGNDSRQTTGDWVTTRNKSLRTIHTRNAHAHALTYKTLSNPSSEMGKVHRGDTGAILFSELQGLLDVILKEVATSEELEKAEACIMHKLKPPSKDVSADDTISDEDKGTIYKYIILHLHGHVEWVFRLLSEDIRDLRAKILRRSSEHGPRYIKAIVK
ncbi:hypothetical protein H0H92_001366, partial [Tricholoma furcatifolium]